jgi:hypothetical protein
VSETVGDTDAEARAIGHELQDQGIYRTEYESDRLRGNLGLAVPENRYTRARRLQPTGKAVTDWPAEFAANSSVPFTAKA